MKPAVFIETTIPSFYFEARSDPHSLTWRQLTRRWWDNERHRFRLLTSDTVLAELALTPGGRAASMQSLLDKVELLDEHPRLHEIAREYIRQKVMPAEIAGDAYHLAHAALAESDHLLTWNCLHLANANKRRHIEIINARLGLHTPVLCTSPMLEARVLP